jgi:CrcB protein
MDGFKAALYVFLGGGAGSVARYLVSKSIASDRFPWATAVVNLIGSFAIGLLLGSFFARSADDPENFILIRGGQSGLALINLFGQPLGGIACAALGFLAAESLFGRSSNL